MNELLARFRALKPVAKIAIVAVPVVLLSCMCWFPLSVGLIIGCWRTEPRAEARGWWNDEAEAKKTGDRMRKWNDAKQEALDAYDAAERSGDPAKIRAALKHMNDVSSDDWQPPKKK